MKCVCVCLLMEVALVHARALAKAAGQQQKDLTLRERFELIQQSRGLKVIELAALNGCGKT